MKSIILLACAIIAGSISALAQDIDENAYIIPVDEYGNISSGDDHSYPDKIPMTVEGDRYILDNVAIQYGFVFFTISADGSRSTFYDIPGWATSPVVIGYPNPLAISSAAFVEPILLQDGTYNISLYRHDIAGQSGLLFSISDAELPEGSTFPAELFLVDSANNTVAIDGIGNGIYSSTVDIPTQFRIAYEPLFDADAFIFGPTSGANVTLAEGEAVPLAYATGTDAVFSYGNERGSDNAKRAMITIDLNEGHQYVEVRSNIITSTDKPSIAEDSSADVFDITGKHIGLSGTAGLPSGLYIVRNADGKAVKVVVR